MCYICIMLVFSLFVDNQSPAQDGDGLRHAQNSVRSIKAKMSIKIIKV